MTSEELKQIYFSFYEKHGLGNRMKELYDGSSIRITDKLSTALIQGFIWDKTTEGWDYWNSIFLSCYKSGN